MSTVAAPRPGALRVAEPRRVPAAVRWRRFLMTVANHSLAIGLAVVFLAPLVFVLLTSLMTAQQALSDDLVPRPVQWANYQRIFQIVPMLRDGYNTAVYAVLSTVGVVVSSVPVAYALSRLRWRGRQFVFLLVLATMMLPPQVTSVPLYVIFVHLQWIGSLKPLIVPNFFGDAFSIFLLRQFFMTIPQELSDAARVDGANELQILLRVVVPLARPAITAVALFQFLFAWNDFFDPLLYVGNNPQSLTLAVALAQLTQNVYVHYGVLWNVVMAGSVLFMLPVIVIFFLAQRVFIQGITVTGIKG